MRRARLIGVALCLVTAGACSSSHKSATEQTTSTTAKSVTTTTKPSATVSTVPTTGSSTTTTLPRPRRTTTALFPPGPIPAADLVFGDNTTAHRIVVTDAQLDEVGLIFPTRTDFWEAVGVSRDGVHLFARKINMADTSPTYSGSRCDQLYELDLRTRALRPVVQNANVLSISPDGTKAVVYWQGGCATPSGRPSGAAAVRDLATDADRAVDLGATSITYNQLAWSPDGTRFAVDAPKLGPPVTRTLRVFSADGALVSQFSRPSSSQDVVAWNAGGLLLVDLGHDGTAVVRQYDPGTGRPTVELGRRPEVELSGLFTPQVGQLFQRADTIYAPAGGGADTRGFAKIWVIRNGRVQLLSNAWSGHFVG